MHQDDLDVDDGGTADDEDSWDEDGCDSCVTPVALLGRGRGFPSGPIKPCSKLKSRFNEEKSKRKSVTVHIFSKKLEYSVCDDP
jgi:hypothetical protein